MNKFKKLIAGVMLGALAVTAIAPATASAHHTGGKNIVEKAVQLNNRTGAFDTLIAAVLCTDGIADALATTQGITVFAPTDRAFRRAGLNANPNSDNYVCKLEEATREVVLKYHVFGGGKVTYRTALRLAKAGPPDSIIPMLDGGTTELKRKGWWRLFIDGASSDPSRIVLPNVRASNGIIHAINRVLLP